MKKIALYSMVAILAASCSSDVLVDDFATAEQQGDQNYAEQINGLTKRVLQNIYDGNVLEVADIYAQFAKELNTRDNSPFLLAFKNVPYLEDGKLTLDLSQIQGEFLGYEDNGQWTYENNPGGLAFGFSHYRGPSLQRCELMVNSNNSDSSYSFKPNRFFEVLIPNAVNDVLMVEGAAAAEDSVETSLFRNNNSFDINISRRMANLSMEYKASVENKLINPEFDFEFKLKDDDEILVDFAKYFDDDDTYFYALAIGDCCYNNEKLYLSFSCGDVDLFFSLLGNNKELAKGEAFDTTLIQNEIENFNADGISFQYYLNNKEVITGNVNLTLKEPDLLVNTYHIALQFVYDTEDGQGTFEPDESLENLLIGIGGMISDIREQILTYQRNYLEGVRNYISFVQTQIERFNTESRNRIDSFINWADERFRLSMDFLANLNEHNREQIDGLLNFFRGLNTYTKEQIDGLLEYIGEFLQELDTYIRS